MSNSKLYQPPPPPPKPRQPAMDPLMALSVKPPPAPVEELVDLTNDDGLEEWAKGGTRIMDKPAPQEQPHPSFNPMVYSAPPPPPMMPRQSSAAIWVVPLALFVLAVGAVMAAGGYYVYHTHDSETAAATVIETATPTVTPAVTETAPPAVTLTSTSTITTATPTPTTTASTITRRRTEASPVNGTIRTFAAGNGKPVYVDGKQVGYGGARISTACGRHLVAVGSGRAKSVDIPCTSTTITVGSPDGS